MLANFPSDSFGEHHLEMAPPSPSGPTERRDLVEIQPSGRDRCNGFKVWRNPATDEIIIHCLDRKPTSGRSNSITFSPRTPVIRPMRSIETGRNLLKNPILRSIGIPRGGAWRSPHLIWRDNMKIRMTRVVAGLVAWTGSLFLGSFMQFAVAQDTAKLPYMKPICQPNSVLLTWCIA